MSDVDAGGLDRFLEVYGTLPRAGPGGDEHTVRALGLVPGRTPRTVLDLGCGPGAQTVALAAALPDARVVAVDVLRSMAVRAHERSKATGARDRVLTVVGDMAAPPVAPGAHDLIWCEGAVYHLGVADALRRWRPLLAAGGSVVFTEPVWIVEAPPAEIAAWWRSEYPAMTDAAGIDAQVVAASYRTIATFALPAAAWWDEYYSPMRERIAALRARFPDDPVALGVAAQAEVEIDHFRRFSDCYTYAFFVVQPAA